MDIFCWSLENGGNSHPSWGPAHSSRAAVRSGLWVLPNCWLWPGGGSTPSQVPFLGSGLLSEPTGTNLSLVLWPWPACPLPCVCPGPWTSQGSSDFGMSFFPTLPKEYTVIPAIKTDNICWLLLCSRHYTCHCIRVPSFVTQNTAVRLAYGFMFQVRRPVQTGYWTCPISHR